jgi:hypothetical protein
MEKPLTLVTADSQTSSVSSLAAFMQHEESTGALRTLQDFDLQTTCWVHSKLFRMIKFIKKEDIEYEPKYRNVIMNGLKIRQGSREYDRHWKGVVSLVLSKMRQKRDSTVSEVGKKAVGKCTFGYESNFPWLVLCLMLIN